MKAWVVKELTHPSNLTLSHDAPVPNPTKSQVLVEVYSAGLNFFDILQAQGKYQNQPPLPFTLGAEFAGRIHPSSPIPQGCPYKHGDRVFGVGQGAYGEIIAAEAYALLPVPEGMTFEEAAGLYITMPTSYAALVDRANVQKGEWVLVHAGAGGVGIAAIQIAKALGANVIATAGSRDKLALCKRYGADHALDYRTPGWQKEVQRITGKGADVIYDPVGLIKDSLKCIAWKGRALVIGFVAGDIEKIPTNLILLKNVSLVGLHWGAYTKHERETIPKVWKALFELFRTGAVKPVVFETVYEGLESMPAGLQALETRKTYGKAVVRIKRDEAAAEGKAKL